MRRACRSLFFFIIICAFCGQLPTPAAAYSVLTHQAIIDVSWEKSLVPLLKKRYPNATEEELRKAHAHAYGGAIIQDMGYYPFGSKFFTDLVHYVRTGDFVLALISESKNLNEYAFSLGALAHYYADTYGHPLGTNKAVPLVYPDVKARFGNVVTYEEDPLAHIKMEFGFDVLQIARGNYAPEAYHSFIGFEVSKEVLERAFFKTYGLELQKQFISLNLAIVAYRRTVSNLFPGLTRAAWNMKADDIQKAKPGITKQAFMYRINRADYREKWGHEIKKPNPWEKFLSWVLRILPKLGPNRAMAFKPPTPEAEFFFMQSFTATADHYSAGLKQVGTQSLVLVNTDFDTGARTKPGIYEKADEAYEDLLQKLAKDNFKNASPELRKDIAGYFAHVPTASSLREDKKDWQKLQKALTQLKALK